MSNIVITKYDFEDKHNQDFISFIEEMYSSYKHVGLYAQTIKKIKSKNNPSFNFIKIKNFIAYEGNKVLGHISAMTDRRLGEKVGLIGFYECIDNLELSKTLIETAIAYLKENKCTLIKAPINLTIWHSYRFVIDQKEAFMLEPITKDYYIKQFTSLDFKEAAEYGSGQREDYETILPYTKPAYDLLLKSGFKIEEVKKDNLDEALLLIHEIAKKTFVDSWSYVEISKDEYSYIYDYAERSFNNLLMEIAYNTRGEAVGFCSSMIDNIDKKIILKSIAVLPDYQNMKIGAALTYSQHKKALEKGMSSIIYALVRMGNLVTKLPYPGVEVIRRYVVLERSIS